MRAGEVRAIHSNGRPWHGRIITFRLCRFTSSTSSLFSTAEVTNNLDVGVFGWSMFWGARTLHSYRGQVVGYVCRRCISSTPPEENVLLRASALRYIREVESNEWTRTATVDDPRRPCLSHALLWIGRLLYSFFFVSRTVYLSVYAATSSWKCLTMASIFLGTQLNWEYLFSISKKCFKKILTEKSLSIR